MPIEPLLTRTCLLLLHSHSTCSYPHPLRHWFSWYLCPWPRSEWRYHSMTIFLSFSIKNHHTECCLYGGFNPDNEAGSWYVEPQTLTERCVPRPARATVERALTEKAKARPKTTRGARTPTPTPGSDKCAVVCRHRRLHALCSLWFTRRKA